VGRKARSVHTLSNHFSLGEDCLFACISTTYRPAPHTCSTHQVISAVRSSLFPLAQALPPPCTQQGSPAPATRNNPCPRVYLWPGQSWPILHMHVYAYAWRFERRANRNQKHLARRWRWAEELPCSLNKEGVIGYQVHLDVDDRHCILRSMPFLQQRSLL